MIKIIPTSVWLALIAVAGIGCGTWGYFSGKENVQNKWDDSRAKGKAIVEELRVKANQINFKTEFVTVEKLVTVKERGDTLVRYVDRYIPQGEGCTTDGMLSGAFRVQHDGAATNRIPNASEYANGEAVSVADVARTVTENYTGCAANTVKLEGWQKWAEEQCKLNSKGCPPNG